LYVERRRLKVAVFIAVVVGVAVTFQANFTSVAQRTMGPVAMVALSGFATTAVAAGISLFLVRPELTGRAVVYAVVSGVLGALILGGIAFAAGQGGVARTISLVIASQLLVSLVLDSIGFLGTDPRGFGPLTILGVALILIGGTLVVRY
jgi:transporter family-2 protein